MEFRDLIDRRQSVRNYSDEEVEGGKVEEILEAARTAPSAGNLKAYDIEVVREEDKKEELSLAARGQDHVREASVDLVFFQDRERSGRKYGDRGRDLYSLQDATIAAAYAQLAATDLGIANCWVGAFDEEGVSEITGNQLRPVAVITLGYSD
ncbi:MAG: nitroreductase family protein [Candidatus Nanohaloarchaeota archaeon QJJ-7]|nr:nitroreductase family protein [Candidatus Nanohaloarchaeota archaeon QJJ-7]